MGGAKGNIGTYSMLERQEGLNEASVAALQLDGGHLLAVADGRGPAPEGRLRAAQMVLQLLRSSLGRQKRIPQDPNQIRKLMRAALIAANNQLYTLVRGEPALQDTECSIAMAIVTGGLAYLAHVGDCRVYLARQGRAIRITDDHTTGGEWIAHGLMSEEQAKENPEAWAFTRAIGVRREVEPSVRGLVLELEKGDTLVLCNATLYRNVDDDKMGQMAARRSPKDLCVGLCKHAVDQGSSRDCRAAAYREGSALGLALQLPPLPRPGPRSLKIGGALLVTGVLLAALALGISHFSGHPVPSPVEKTGSLVDVIQHDDTSPPPETSAPAIADIREYRPEPAPRELVELRDTAVQPDLVTADMQAVPETRSPAEIQSPVDIRAVPEVTSEPDVRQAPEVAPQPDLPRQPDVHPQPEVTSTVAKERGYRPHGAARDCHTFGLSGNEAETTEKAARFLEKAFEEVGHRNTSGAVGSYYDAVNTLNKAPQIAWDRCGWAVKELRNRIKKRYLRMANSAALKAAKNPDRRAKHCRSGKRRTRDARKFGASDSEVKKALGRCGKK